MLVSLYVFDVSHKVLVIKSNRLYFQGNRIVDINFMFDDICRLNRHSKQCNFNDMVLKRESKFGFRSYLYYSCTKCPYVDVIRTSEPTGDRSYNTNQEPLKKPDINYSAVLGMMSIGSAFSHLEEFSSE